MKAQHHRTTNRAKTGLPGSVTRRRTSTASGASSRSSKAPRKATKAAHRQGNGARVIMLMVGIGSIIAVGFILAQHSLINVLQLKRAEESLKSELDTLSSQQRFYTFKKEQALSTQESDRAANESGLIQPGLGKTVVSAVPAVPETGKQAKSESQVKALSSELVTKVPDKRTATAKPSTKVANTAKVIKVANKAIPAGKSDKTKPDKTKKDTPQIAKHQKPQKEVKRQR
ncbi:MAG: hypothetical protein JNK38_08540 [Acidobacteria bacterium]|nr:hypothetical protein [Acidobacteriota bacterium]